MRHRRWIGGLAAAVLLAHPQTLAGQGAATAPQASPAPARASWLSDRRPLRVGDLLTVVIDEQVSARERSSTRGESRRGLEAELGLGIDSAVRIGPQKAFGSSLDAGSRQTGEADRRGDLTAVMSVRVVALEAGGLARVEGARVVSVDGRKQEFRLSGLVRAADVTSSNLIYSSRIAEAVISYKGKKLGPSKGILGGLLSVLWP